MDTTQKTHREEKPRTSIRIRPRIKIKPSDASVTLGADVDVTRPVARATHNEAGRALPGPDESLRRMLNTAGWVEIVVFGLPLIFAGRRVAKHVTAHDPHIYKEYGVARIVMGLAFLIGARRARERKVLGRIGSIFYGSNIIVSLVDLAMANVSRAELAVVALSTVFSAALGRLSMMGVGRRDGDGGGRSRSGSDSGRRRA